MVPTIMSFDEIAELKMKLQAIIFSIGDGIILTDFEGGIGIINDRAKKMLGIQKGYPYEKKFLEYIQDEWIKDKLGNLLKDKEIYSSTEIEMDTARGEVYLHATKHLVTTAQGILLGQVIVLHDVTPEKQFEKMKDDFVNAITHDLKSPIASLQGFLKLFLEGELGEIAPEQKHYLEIMSHSAFDLQRMVNDILDVSKLESGKMTLTKSDWNIQEVISKIVDSLHGVARHCQIAISQNFHSDFPNDSFLLHADRTMIERVLHNLLDNALKFTPGGGSIDIEVESHAKETVFSIRDTGKGIPQESQSTIFEKFKQVPGTKNGVGLGLAIAKHIVEAHGGHISLTSQIDSGTTVSFSIPKIDKPFALHS